MTSIASDQRQVDPGGTDGRSTRLAVHIHTHHLVRHHFPVERERAGVVDLARGRSGR